LVVVAKGVAISQEDPKIGQRDAKKGFLNSDWFSIPQFPNEQKEKSDSDPWNSTYRNSPT